MGKFGKRALIASALGGAFVTIGGLYMVMRVDPCVGLSARGIVELGLGQCSDVGPYKLHRGIWIDGFEERRFFPNATLVPKPVPDSNNRLIIDEAAKDFIYRTLPEIKRPIASQVIQIEFWGNELRPYGSTTYGRYYDVRRVVSTRLLRRDELVDP